MKNLNNKTPVGCVRLNLALCISLVFASCSSAPKGDSYVESPQKQMGHQIWSSSSKSLQNPESAFYDSDSKTVYVSNVAGGPTKKDGKGWIDRYSSTGKLIKKKWAKGFNAPKGMRIANGILWVSDIDRVIGINKKSGKVIKKISIKGAKFLNDVASDPKGNIYISDTFENKIFKISKAGKTSVFMKGPELESPNGLIADDKNLYVATWGPGMNLKDWSTTSPGRIYKINFKTKRMTAISGRIGNLDGIEWDKDGNFIVSDWVAGKVYSVSPDQKATLVYKTDPGTADIGMVKGTNTVIIPEMQKNRLTAFKL